MNDSPKAAASTPPAPVLRTLRIAVAGLLVAVCALGRPASAPAQGVPAAYGLLAGSAAGTYVTTGIFVAEARAGSYLYDLEDALAPRWELIPAVAMPIGGLVLGLDDGQRLAGSIAWGGAGFATGGVLGFGLGELLGETPEGRWAGAVVGSAAGLLIGSVYGAVSYSPEGDEEERAGPTLGLSVPMRGPE